MKLHELNDQRQTEQIAKTLSRRLGDQVRFDRLSESQAKTMLGKVQSLLVEYRTSVSRHFSERNPDYLRLMMLEQALTKRIDEKYMGFEKLEKSIAKRGDVRDPAAVAASIGRKKYGKEKFQKAAAAGKKLKENRLVESEIQTAQVVLAAQDMIDRVQGMMEDISEMQFKDLPALVDSIKNDMGAEQATRYQTDAAAALTQLLSAIQAGKQQLESAQGVLTGQAPIVPGTDAGAMPAELPPAGEEEEVDLSLDANLPSDEDEDEEITGASLGRERR